MYLNLVKSLPFYIPEAWKRYPFRAEPSRIGHYREYPPGRPLGIACLKCHLSNSLIIHQIKTENHNSQLWRRFGHLVLIDDFASRVPLHRTLDTFTVVKSPRISSSIYTAARRILISLLGVCISRWNTLVFDLVFHKIFCQPWGI